MERGEPDHSMALLGSGESLVLVGVTEGWLEIDKHYSLVIGGGAIWGKLTSDIQRCSVMSEHKDCSAVICIKR